MTNTIKNRMFLAIIVIYALLKIVTLATFTPLAIRFSILAFLQSAVVLAIVGIQAYATYMVIKNRQMIWIIFFALWSVVTVVAVPIQLRKIAEYAKAARSQSAPIEQQTGEIKEIQHIKTGKELESLIAASTQPVVVKVSTTWCPPCKAIKPHFEALSQELGNSITFAEIDADSFTDKKMLNIKGIPAILCYKNGREVMRIVGYRTKKDLHAELLKLVH